MRCKCGSTNVVEDKQSCLTCLSARQELSYIEAGTKWKPTKRGSEYPEVRLFDAEGRIAEGWILDHKTVGHKTIDDCALEALRGLLARNNFTAQLHRSLIESMLVPKELLYDSYYQHHLVPSATSRAFVVPTFVSTLILPAADDPFADFPWTPFKGEK